MRFLDRQGEIQAGMALYAIALSVPLAAKWMLALQQITAARFGDVCTVRLKQSSPSGQTANRRVRCRGVAGSTLAGASPSPTDCRRRQHDAWLARRFGWLDSGGPHICAQVVHPA